MDSGWTIANEMNGMNFGIWTQQKWSVGKIIWQHKHDWGREHKHTNKMMQLDGYAWHPPLTINIFTVHYSSYWDGLINLLPDQVV